MLLASLWLEDNLLPARRSRLRIDLPGPAAEPSRIQLTVFMSAQALLITLISESRKFADHFQGRSHVLKIGVSIISPSLRRSPLSARVPECQKLKMYVRSRWH